jgi:uncharacterized membrane protein
MRDCRLTAPLTPMHQVGSTKTLADYLHIVATVLDILFIFLIVGLGSKALDRHFHLYSSATVLILLVSGALIGLDVSRLGTSQRTNKVAPLTWVVVLATALLRSQADDLVR